MNRSIRDLDIKKLYGLSAARCNLCGTQLIFPKQDVDGFVHIGEMAHIIAYADNPIAPRFIDGASGDNTYSNLILLCANHHKEVDSNPSYYTKDKLEEIKRCHEEKIARAISEDKNLDNGDIWLVKTIEENYNLQLLLTQLSSCHPRVSLPINIYNIDEIKVNLLDANCPRLYPFKDEILNNLFDEMVENIKLIHNYVVKSYFIMGNPHQLIRSKEPYHELTEYELQNIEKIVEKLKNSIFNWLRYCRDVGYFTN
jgi:hypothetical protein